MPHPSEPAHDTRTTSLTHSRLPISHYRTCIAHQLTIKRACPSVLPNIPRRLPGTNSCPVGDALPTADNLLLHTIPLTPVSAPHTTPQTAHYQRTKPPHHKPFRPYQALARPPACCRCCHPLRKAKTAPTTPLVTRAKCHHPPMPTITTLHTHQSTSSPRFQMLIHMPLRLVPNCQTQRTTLCARNSLRHTLLSTNSSTTYTHFEFTTQTRPTKTTAPYHDIIARIPWSRLFGRQRCIREIPAIQHSKPFSPHITRTIPAIANAKHFNASEPHPSRTQPTHTRTPSPRWVSAHLKPVPKLHALSAHLRIYHNIHRHRTPSLGSPHNATHSPCKPTPSSDCDDCSPQNATTHIPRPFVVVVHLQLLKAAHHQTTASAHSLTWGMHHHTPAFPSNQTLPTKLRLFSLTYDCTNQTTARMLPQHSTTAEKALTSKTGCLAYSTHRICCAPAHKTTPPITTIPKLSPLCHT
jgi:hypothetical protein